MRFGLLNQQDIIDTSDLYYNHPEGKYIYAFKYIGNGIFFLQSKGAIDDSSFKHQLHSGDIARERLKKIFPDKKYHLIWDISEVARISVITRKLIFTKLSTTNNFGSINVIGGNYLAISFAKIISKLFPGINFSFFRSYEEALKNIEQSFHPSFDKIDLKENFYLTVENEAYAHFIDLWQEKQAKILINNTYYKYLTKPEWDYESPDHSFKVNVCVIEGNIVFYQLEGEAKPFHIDKVYAIIKEVFQELRFSPTNKVYSIVDIRKLANVSLEARKKTSYYEHYYHSYCHKVFAISSYSLKLLVRSITIINSREFKHWEIMNSVEEAFSRAHHLQYNKNHSDVHINTISEIEDNSVAIPSTHPEMVNLIKKQYDEINRLKEEQSIQIKRILEVTSRLTWDESCEQDLFNISSESPYGEIFDLLSILYKDFREIIKEKTRHAQQLKESEDKYKNLIELANDIIVVYQDNAIRFVNSRVSQALGYTTEELIGASMHNYLDPNEINKLQEFYKKRISGENLPSVYETILIHKDGHKVHASMSVGRIIYDNRPAVMLIARDISQKKRIEEELDRYRNHLEDIIRKRTEQLQKEISERRIAEESDRLKTAFLSNMSHEIRTPMNAIIAFSDYLKNMDLTGEQRLEYLNYIQSSGQSLLNLINDIIDISKIESKQVDIQLSSLNVNKFMDELIVLFEETRKNKNKTEIVLRLNKPKEQISLYTDQYRLKQILSNLLDNALKFTEKGFIELGCQLKNNNIVFYVTDTGEGIPADKMDVIFKRFGRINSSKRKISGTGLGLAISKNLALLLNGKLWVESKVNEGSTFYLKIPNYITVEPIEPEAPKNTPVKKIFNWEDKKILIAEDEDLNFRVLQIALARTRATIIRAQNGLEAVSLVNSTNNLDIVLMDIQMPEMDGYEAMSKIKQHHKIPIIAQTAFALLEEKNRCIEIGFDDYVSKPIKLDELFQKMEEQFEKYRK
jgi:PAS domain S-box-containing protein